jgi:2',3'-cyclic-nucleotide 2'-phosphodiesterase (5'-nucleotidase family)
MGGLPRRATYIAQKTTEGFQKIIVDSGDFSSPGSKHGEFKTEWMIHGMGDLGYDAVAVGERDLQLGRARLLQLAKKYSLPLVCANLFDTDTNEFYVKPYVIVEKGNKSFLGLMGHSAKVGIFAVISPTFITPVAVRGEKPLKVTDPVRAAETAIKKLQEEGCTVIIALAHTSIPEAGRIAALGGLSAIVMGHALSYVREPRFDNGAVIVQAGREGRYIGDIQIEVGQGNEVESVEGKVEALSSTYKDDPHFAALISEYKKALEVHVFAPQRTQDAGVQLYVGKSTCGSCHADELEQWETTAHAHAFATLVQNKSHFDPECVRCHVTGYGRGNGFKDANTTPAMADVQCEVCHGPGFEHFRFHSKSGEKGSEAKAEMAEVTESICLQCHTDDRDPGFDYEKKIAEVTH